MSEISVGAVIRQLVAPRVNYTRVIDHLRRSPDLLDALHTALSSEVTWQRLGSAKALRTLSAHAPDLLYPRFETFVNLLCHQNSVLRWNAMLVLENLAPVDDRKRIDHIVDEYLSPISGPLLVDAANTIAGATAIAKAKPYLADKIAGRILTLETANYHTPECRHVAIGHAIKAFHGLVSIVTDKRAIELFVLRQLDNTRPATRKKAEAFLRKWPLKRSAEH